MIFRPLDIDGMFLVDLERQEDERGFFARTYCAGEFRCRGLNTDWPQCNMSHSSRRGTLRGIHYQAPPEADAKLIRVTRGSIFAVAVDLRTDSRSSVRSLTCPLSREGSALLYIPAGCGFGFQTLEDETELSYQMSVAYRPDLARGIRWNDPALGIRWPLPPTCISSRDAALPQFHDIVPALQS